MRLREAKMVCEQVCQAAKYVVKDWTLCYKCTYLMTTCGLCHSDRHCQLSYGVRRGGEYATIKLCTFCVHLCTSQRQ